MSKFIKINCPTCNSKGKIKYTFIDDGGANRYMAYDYKECEKCEGTGKIDSIAIARNYFWLMMFARKHYRKRWILFTDGFVIGNHIWFKKELAEISSELMHHKLCHVGQYRDLRYREWMWTGVIAFWCVYSWQWICSACKYEAEAHAAGKLLKGMPYFDFEKLKDVINKFGVTYEQAANSMHEFFERINE